MAHTWRGHALAVVICGLLTAGVASAQQNEADRERTERVADILVALGAKDGARIADVGSADGFYALRIARAVAPNGRAYAVDIDQAALTKLGEYAKRDGITNVEAILGASDDPKLPPDEIDAVLIRNAYHEMPEYRGVLAGVTRALKPGGTLIVIEAIHDNLRAKTRAEQVKEHEIAPEIVEAELRDAGFEIVERQDSFTTFTRPPPGGFWMIRARRPGSKQYTPTSMAGLDEIARSSTIALLAIMGFVSMRDFRRTPMAMAAVAFFFTIGAHLALTSPDYSSVPGLDLVLQFGALAAPGAFMIFARALFDEDADVTWTDAAIVGGLIAAGLLRSTPAGSIGVGLYYTGSLAVVVFALGHVLRGLSSDLVEPRRQLRAFFVLASGIEMLIVIGGEILLAGERPPRWIDAAKSLSALGLTFMFAAWFLAPRRELFAVGQPVASAPAKAPAPALDETRHGDRLLALMQVEKIYRQEGLTIARLARTLDLPEYRLRRVINQQLGYRNFNAFLNDFRIEDACVVLADPAQERLPILNLALDLGYGSPGPFNRAFRAKTGYTPTEYRRMRLGTSSPAA